MAKNESKNTPATSNKRGRKEEAYEAPEGFGINVGREMGEGWIVKEEGNEVMARLLSRHTYKTKRGKTRAFYQLRLIKATLCQVANPDFNEEDEETDDNPAFQIKTLEEGSIVNVDEFKKLEDLQEYMKDGKTYDVWFVMGGKIELDDSQTMWTLKAGPKLRPVADPQS